MEEIKKYIYQVNLWDILKTQKINEKFAIKYILNPKYQLTESEKMIADNAPNWEADRIATMDMVILKMALAEAQTFESIPLKVTMNEYIELANYYSTPKSNVFINGLLETLFSKLMSDGKINKIGRGLIDA